MKSRAHVTVHLFTRKSRLTKFGSRTLRIAAMLIVLGFIHGNVSAQTAASLAWDESPLTGITGYAITIDGIRTDYGLAPVGSTGTCGCAVALPFSGGQHTLKVSAYNSLGESWSSPLMVAPVANPGGAYSGVVGADLPFDGSGSTDPTGTITGYSWTWGDGSSVTSSSAATPHTYTTSGTFPVTLTVTDNGGATATANTTASIVSSTPISTNRAPVAADDTASVTRRASVTIPVLTNDSDADADPLTIISFDTPSRGSVRISSGQLVYTSAKHYLGQVDFTYTISDGRGATATASVHVTVRQ